MELKEYISTPLVVEAVQVTDENMREVARWCEGIIKKEDLKKGPTPYIAVNVIRPSSARQAKAYVGDWVSKHRDSYKVYTRNAFERCYQPCTNDNMPEAQLIDRNENHLVLPIDGAF